MVRCFSYLLVFFLLSPVLSLYGQDNDTLIPQEEIEEMEEIDDEYGSYFNPREQPAKIAERTIDEEKVLAIKKEDDYWYADLHPEKEKPEPDQKSFLQSDFAKTIFWILLTGAFVALLIWFLASGNINLFRRKSGIYESSQDLAEEEEDIFGINYEQEIQKAVNEKNFRLAVRLLYLQVLKEMAERNIIKYSHEKTNSDYVFQLNKSRYYKTFFTLTRHFEYTWYGQFAITAETYQLVQKDFSSFKQQLN